MTLQHITLGGGCFWCTEAVFTRLRGIHSVQSGYANGHTSQPSYEQVCTGQTGHAEVVQLAFDPATIGLQQILQVFFATHDPTTLNRQGHDVGTQYRSAIYWHSPEQEVLAHDVIAEMTAQGVWGDAPIVTEVAPLRAFWPAEAYHQQYYARHPEQGYCAAVIAPKLNKFRQTFVQWLHDGKTGAS